MLTSKDVPKGNAFLICRVHFYFSLSTSSKPQRQNLRALHVQESEIVFHEACSFVHSTKNGIPTQANRKVRIVRYFKFFPPQGSEEKHERFNTAPGCKCLSSACIFCWVMRPRFPSFPVQFFFLKSNDPTATGTGKHEDTKADDRTSNLQTAD